MAWRCAICGRTHDEQPLVFGAEAPWRFFVPEAEFAGRVELHDSLCIIDAQQFYVRGHILLPIHGTSDHLIWSVWCSISEASFTRSRLNWSNPERDQAPPYFGWLCTELPSYEPTTWHLKTMLYEREPGVVPLVHLEPTEHPLAVAQREGVSMDQVQAIVHQVMHISDAAD